MLIPSYPVSVTIAISIWFFRDILRKERKRGSIFFFLYSMSIAAHLSDTDFPRSFAIFLPSLPSWQRLALLKHGILDTGWAEKRMELKLNPCFDIELSALTDVRRNSLVGSKRFKCSKRKTWKTWSKLSPFFFSRSVDRSLSIKDPLVFGNRWFRSLKSLARKLRYVPSQKSQTLIWFLEIDAGSIRGVGVGREE